MSLTNFLHSLGITGEDPGRTSAVTARSFKWLRIVFGLIILYDAWASVSFAHKTQMGAFMGLSIESPWLHVAVAIITFIEIAVAVSLLSGRGIGIMGWVGVAYGLLVWLVVEQGGEFEEGATDPGIGLPYVVVFLFVIGVDRLRNDPDLRHNQILSLARVSFALLWAYDALLKFQPYFIENYMSYIPGAGKDMSGMMSAASAGTVARMMATYDHAWVVISQTLNPQLVAGAVGVIEAALAVGLLAGRGLRILGPIGLGLSFVIWSVPEQWGGPYSFGVADMPMSLLGIAVIYMMAHGYVWVLYNPADLFAAKRAGKAGTMELSHQQQAQPQ